MTPSPEQGNVDGAGSGGAHGGGGGDAASFRNITGCKGGAPYDNKTSPGDMGSGGGGDKGGQGGGVLHLHATKLLYLDGNGAITADGASAAAAERGGGSTGAYIEGGSGGGSGGSVILEVRWARRAGVRRLARRVGQAGGPDGRV